MQLSCSFRVLHVRNGFLSIVAVCVFARKRKMNFQGICNPAWGYIKSVQKFRLRSDTQSIMVKMFRILAAALAGTVMYVLVSFACGRDGVWADGQLREQKRILTARTDEIQKINDSLSLEYTALEKDPDVIAGFARKMGYVRDGEKIVKINGLVSVDEYHFETGTPIKSAEPYFLPEWFCKTAGILMFFVAYLYLLLKKDGKRNAAPAKKITIKGIPVYDLPQM